MSGMPPARNRLAAVLLMLASAMVSAEEQLTLPSPDGWRTLSNLVAPLLRRSEFVIPAAGGVSGDGPDKLSFEWFAHELAPGLDPLDLAAQLTAGVRRECVGSRDNPVFAGYENGYPTVVRLITCPQRRGSPGGEREGRIGEVLMLKAVQGATGHWLIVRGRQLGLSSTGASTGAGAGADAGGADGQFLSPDTVRDWTAELRAITLCDPAQGDAHPCPAVPEAARVPPSDPDPAGLD